MKQRAIYLILIISSLAASAQVPITVESFENYTAGVRLCTQAPAYWFTWNNGPGTAEDAVVSDSLSVSGNKSLLVSGSNDILLSLLGKSAGRYEISFHIMVPEGKTGFYGLIQQFSGNESVWGMQCFFDENKKGTIKSDGNSVDFVFTNNQWIFVKNIVDLDNDHSEIYIGNSLVYEWQWSKGLTGTAGITKLDALNFFAWKADQRNPEMFIDSIVFKEIPAPGPPLNLNAAVSDNDVNLSWDAPADGIPLGYKIYRDSLVIISSQTELIYTDTDVYPGKYKYVVKAIYSTGLSQPTDPVEALIQGGTARKYVLLEIATGTWCTYCPGSAMGADDLVESGANVAVIEYHDNDDYENNDANQRNSYYNITGYPTAKFDGSTTISGGNMTQSMYPSYLPVYNNHIKKLSLFDLDMVVIQSGETELQISITTKKIYAYENNNLRLHLVLTETHIPENWQGIMTEVNSVCRKMYPDYKGNVADFSNDSILVFNYTITVDTTFEFNNCALVAFIQDNATKEVLQVDNINFNSLGRTEPEEINTSVYPNPCSGSFCLSITQKGTEVYKMEIQNNFGACVYRNDDLRVNGTFKQYFDVHNLSDGMYNLILRSETQQILKKFVISK